jgi:hypothetical protein
MKEHTVRTPHYAFLIFPVLFLFGSYGCESVGESTVGSPSDTEITRMAFFVDTTYISGSTLYARGRVQNNGSNGVNPPWYVEAQFYTDANYTTKLGGNNTSISVPLSPGQSTFWTISFSSSNVDVRNYPGFTVKDLRAIYKN